LDTSETIPEISGKFRNVVMEKDGEDHLDLSCEKRRTITKRQGGENYPKNNKEKEVELDWTKLA